jgi:hypothetical protein
MRQQPIARRHGADIGFWNVAFLSPSLILKTQELVIKLKLFKQLVVAC